MSKMRLADYVAYRLADYGVQHIFMVTGGGAMFLNVAIGREKRLTYICNHHEQASAIAAESYARVTNSLGVINVTTGPGGINALNGVFGAYTDSIPMLIVSGQVKRETCLASYDLPRLRQLGDQEVDIVRMVGGITKYAVLVDDPNTIRFHLEKAIHLATTGRPGPCWLDIPVDVQSSMIDGDALPGYDPQQDAEASQGDVPLAQRCQEIVERLQRAERPVIMLGSGVRLAGAEAILETVTRRLGVPVTTAWTTPDLIASDDPLYCGRPGTVGDRAGNFTVQNADLVLVIGCRLNIRQVSYNWHSFARHAHIIQVDIDAAELDKPMVRPHTGIVCDARLFLEELDRQIDHADFEVGCHAKWLAWCRERVARYPAVMDRQRVFNGAINPYHFIDTLYRKLDSDDVTVCGDATAAVVTFQVAHIKKGQRLFSNSGSASMGYDLPAAVGAAVARSGNSGNKRVICLAGDGSVQMNVQELQTMAHHQLPIKLFVLNNGGYLSIRLTQANFFKGNFVGEGGESGVSFPDMLALGKAYGLESVRIEGADFESELERVLNTPGPVVCEVMLDPEQGFEPKLSSRQLPDGKMVTASLEDMAPFLESDELKQNMLVALPE